MSLSLCHIVPIPLLSLTITPLDTTHLVLAELIDTDEEYVEFYLRCKARGDFIILDSSAFEVGKANPELMVRVALGFDPSEVVLPDDMESSLATYDMSKEAAHSLIAGGYRGKMMAVPHGNDLDDYKACAEELASIRGVTTLGIQEEAPELFDVKRSDLAAEFYRDLGVEIHYLGFEESLMDLRDPVSQAVVRTADSAKLVIWGLNGDEVKPSEEAPPYPGRAQFGGRLDYFDYANPKNVGQVQINMMLWRQYLRGS